MEDCHAIRRILKKKTSLSIQLLMGEEQFEKVDVVVVPSYIVKGLEFDVVIIVNVDAAYREEELDIKLLYVAMTRPLHQLYIYAQEASMPLLAKVSNDMLKRVKL
jgi:DNA helicase-2/ATP-dependent DNA helicase PcrA